MLIIELQKLAPKETKFKERMKCFLFGRNV